MRFLVTVILMGFVLKIGAATVDTVSIYSGSMNKTSRCVVIVPDNLKVADQRFPVLYLLHGWTGNYSNWIKKVPELKKYADQYRMIIVCPDGDNASWYFDSPVNPNMRYETYISKEVPAFIDSAYATIKDRKARAITGLSMGGHGAMFIAFRNSETFAACGSMSGAMDLYAFRRSYDIAKQLGDTLTQKANYFNYSLLEVAGKKITHPLTITFDCGTSDPFFPSNEALHKKLLELKVPHEYTARPGNHDWQYWQHSIFYHVVFFANYFNRQLVGR